LRRAKAQVASLDIIISVAAIICLIVIIIILFPARQETRQVYGGRIFDSLDSLNERRQDVAFLHDYSIDEARLTAFAALDPEQAEMLAFAGTAHSSETSDLCIYFANKDRVMNIGMDESIGRTYTDQAHTTKSLCPTSNPCRHYRTTTVYTRPVARQEQIVNMHMVVCS
jgi:hypothetical protein